MSTGYPWHEILGWHDTGSGVLLHHRPRGDPAELRRSTGSPPT